MCVAFFKIKKKWKMCVGGSAKCQGLPDHITVLIFYITRDKNTSFVETEIFYLIWKLLLILKTFKQTSIKNWTQCYHEGGGFYSWSKNRMRLWTTDSPYFLYNMSKSPSNLSSSCKSQVNFPITTKISFNYIDNLTFKLDIQIYNTCTHFD